MDLENKRIIIEFEKYEPGTFLLGANFNTNRQSARYIKEEDRLEYYRESYCVFYLGKLSLILGVRNKPKKVKTAK